MPRDLLAPGPRDLLDPDDKENTWLDSLKQLGAGTVEGVEGLIGLPGTAAEGMTAGSDWLRSKFGMGPSPELPIASSLQAPSVSDVQGARESVAGKLPPDDGGLERKVGQFAPGILFGGGSVLRRGVGNVLAPAGGAEIGEEVTGGSQTGEMVGALLGALSPAAISRGITPLPITPQRQELVDYLRSEGVDSLTAGQVTGRKGLQYAESEIGGGATQNIVDRGNDQFTSATIRRFNPDEGAPRATPDVVNDAFERLGGTFDELELRNDLVADQQLMDDLAAVRTQYDADVLPNQQKPVVRNTIEQLMRMDPAGNAIMPGASYQPIRSQLRRSARSNSVPEHRAALNDLANALDDAMERSMQRRNATPGTALVPQGLAAEGVGRATPPGNADDMALWRAARDEYRHLMTAERALGGAGPDAAMGAITPARLRQADVGKDRRGHIRGTSAYSDLSHAGPAIMTPMPNSGTAARSWSRHVPSGMASILGATLGGHAGDTMGAIGGAIGGAMAPAIVGRGLMSRPAQSWLMNQFLQQGMSFAEATRRAALVEALLAGRQSGEAE